jgi:hypothetical protein
MKMKQRDFHRTKIATVAHTEYSIRKWGSKPSDDDVANNYLVNQSISESMNASSGQMLWQQKLYLSPDRNYTNIPQSSRLPFTLFG